jgi:hypothetical protein
MNIYEWGFTEKYSVYEPESYGSQDVLNGELGSIDQWEPIKFIEVRSGKGRHIKGAPGDFPGTTSFNHLVSQVAVDALGNMLTDFGELFPVKLEGQDKLFYIFECTNVVDCLNEDMSMIVRSDLGFMQSIIVTLPVFYEDKIGGNHVFTVPQLPKSQSRIYVTERFKDEVIKAGLKGLFLHKGNMSKENPWLS